jgi:hypothetical protein
MLLFKRPHAVQVIVDVSHPIGFERVVIPRTEKRRPYLYARFIPRWELSKEFLSSWKELFRLDTAPLKFKHEGACMVSKAFIEWRQYHLPGNS